MPSSISGFISEIRQKRDNELATQLQSVIPLLEQDMVQLATERKYKEQKSKVAEDYRKRYAGMIPDSDPLKGTLVERFGSDIDGYNTIEGLGMHFNQESGRYSARKYGEMFLAGLSPKTEGYEDIVSRIRGAQDMDELKYTMTEWSEKNGLREIIDSSATLMRNSGTPKDKIDEFVAMASSLKNPTAIKALGESFMGKDYATIAKENGFYDEYSKKLKTYPNDPARAFGEAKEEWEKTNTPKAKGDTPPPKDTKPPAAYSTLAKNKFDTDLGRMYFNNDQYPNTVFYLNVGMTEDGWLYDTASGDIIPHNRIQKFRDHSALSSDQRRNATKGILNPKQKPDDRKGYGSF